MPQINETQEIGESKEKNVAEILKLALGHATFENKDIGGLVFGLLDSLSSDIILAEFEESDTTVSLMSDLVDTVKEEIDDIAGRIDDEDDEEEVNENGNGDDEDDDEVNEEGELLNLRTLVDLDDNEDDEDDDDLPEELGEVDEDDDDEIVDPTKNDKPE